MTRWSIPALWLSLGIGCWSSAPEAPAPAPEVAAADATDDAPKKRKRKRRRKKRKPAADAAPPDVPPTTTEVDEDADEDTDGPSIVDGLDRKARRALTGPGKWRKTTDDAALAAAQAAEIARLEAIGYADGTTEVVGRGIDVHDPKRAYQGLNLWHDGHASAAYLTTMEGEVLHQWAVPFATAFPEISARPTAPGINHWRRVLLGDGGDLYAVHEGRGIVALDAASNVRWARANRAHHHLAWLPDGNLGVLVREGRIVEALHPTRPVLVDRVEVLDPATGEVLRTVDLLDAFLAGPRPELVTGRTRSFGDLMHTNTLTVLDADEAALHPDWDAGDWLVSSRTLSMIGVVDPEAGAFTWVHTGGYRRQHDAIVDAKTNRILMFDNVGGPGRNSRLLALDLPQADAGWSWMPEADVFKSPTLGAVQVLPNGDLLATASERGHAVELDPASGDVVWSFWTPHRAGPEGEFIAALFEVHRLPPSTDVRWAKKPDTP